MVILNWQRPLCRGDQEVVKRSGRDEPMWVVTHMYMEETLGISLYSYVFIIISYVFSSTNQRTRGWKRFFPEEVGKWPKQCIHM
jgi:hypothetical protein